MKIQRMPEDIVPLLNDLVRRLTALETRPLGTVFINESLIIKDPDTGVETIIGDLHGEGEDRHGIKQWVGDTTPPPIPTSPMVSANLGVFSVAWDGDNKDGIAQAPDFDHINVYGNNGTSTMIVGVIKTKDEVAIVTGAEYSVPWTFWFTSVDFNGNESAKSDDSLPISVTPLVEELDMKEILDDINDRFGGVITEAERLNEVLADAEQTIADTKTGLNTLKNTTLPAVESRIDAAHQELVESGAELDARLGQAEIDLNTAEAGLNTLKNTDLPAMKSQIEATHQEIVTTGAELGGRLAQAETDLNTAEAGLNTLKNTDLPALRTRLGKAELEITTTGSKLSTRLTQAEKDLDTAEASLNTLKNTTLPALNQRLADAETEINETGVELGNRLNKAETDLTGHNTRISSNESKITTLNNTTLPGLSADLSGAKTRLTAAEGEIATTKGKLSTAERTLNTLKNTTIPALNTEVAGAKTRLTATETEVTSAKTRLGKTETDLTSAFGQITAVDTKAGNAQTAASNAQTAVDDAIKDLDRVWATARRSFYWAGDTLEGVTTTSTFNPTIDNVADAPSSSSVLRKNGTKGSVYWDAKPIPFDPSALYKITFKIRVVSDATNISSPLFYAGVHAWAASANGGPSWRISTSGTASTASAHYFAAGSDSAVAADGWITVVGYFQGLAPEGTSGGGEHKDITDPGQMVSMTKYISPMALLDYSSGNGVWDVGMVAIDVVPAELQAQVVAAQAKADSAQSKADSAHTAAGTAQSTADNALTMAGSKSKVFYSTSNPSGTASLGDTWRKVNASNDVIAEWRWTAGNTWLTQQISSEAISNLDVGKLTAGSAIIKTAVVNKIAIQTADVIKLNASAITAGTISADRLNVTDLAAKIATVIKLNADTITAGTIDTGRINATEVAAAVATVIQLNASRITAGVISTDRLNATEIAARVATVIQLNASSITAGIISTDRLDVNDIAAKTASFQKVDVKNLFATTGTFSEAVIEKLWADVIRAKKITTDQLLVGSGSNLIVDPYFEDETTKAFRATLASNMSGGYGRNATTNLNWFGGTQTAGTVQTYYFSTINSRIKTDSMIPMVEGSKYRFKFLYNSTGGGARPVVSIVRKDGTNGVTTSGFKINGVLTSSYGSAGLGQIMEAVWEPAPSWDYAYFIPGIQWESTVTSAHIYAGASVQNMADGNLIVSGSIDADKINTNSVVAEVAKFIELDVSKLTATNATMSEAVVNKLWTDVIRSRKITTDMLLVGQGENYIADPEFDDANLNASRVGSSDWSTITNSNWGNGFTTRSTSTADMQLTNTTNGYISVEPDGVYTLSIMANGADQVQAYMQMVYTDGYTASGPSIRSFSGISGGDPKKVSVSWDFSTIKSPGGQPVKEVSLRLRRTSTPSGATNYATNVWSAWFGRLTDASLIVDGSIAAKQIDSLSVTAEVAKFLELDVAKLKVTAGATMNEAVIEKLWTDVVRSKKITTDQLLVGQGENLIPWDVTSTVPNRTDNFVGYGGGSVKPSVQGLAGVADGNHLYMVADWVTSGSYTLTWRIMADPSATPWGTQGFKVEPEEEFQATIYVKAGGSYSSGTPNVRLSGVWYKADGTYIATNSSDGSTLAWTWGKREVSLKAPATAAYLHLFIQQDQPGGVRVDLPSLYRKKGASLIVDGTIAAKHIDSESVSAEVAKFIDLDVSRLVATNATINTAVVNKLWTDVIRSRKITTDMMIVGSGGNHHPDPQLTDPDGWAQPTYIKNAVGRNGGKGIVVPASTGQVGTYYGLSDKLRQHNVIAGQEYRIGVWVKSTVAIPLSGVAIFNRYSNDAVSTGAVETIYNSGTAGTIEKTPRLGVIPANTWRLLEGFVKMPTGAEQAYLGLYVSAGFNAAVTFSEPSVQTASGTGLIVDGAIEAKHITASESMSAKLGEFLTLNVENFNVTGTGKMSEAVITKLWTDVVQSKKITSNMIAIGDFSNYAIINPATDTNVVEPTGWATATEGNYTKNVSGSYLMFKNRDKNVPFFSGDKVRIVFDAKTTTGTVTTTPNIWTYTNAGAGAGTFSGSSATITTTEKTFESIISVDSVSPSAAEWVTGISSSSIGNVRVRNVRVQRMEAGELIVDGAVTALKIKGDSIESQHIKTNAVTADKIEVGAVTALKIKGDSIESQHIKTNAVTADKIEVGAIRASHISMGYGRELATNGDGKLKSNVGYEGFSFQTRSSATPEGVEGYFYSGFGQGTTNFLNGDSLLRVKPNTEYKVTTWVMASESGSVVYLQPMITGTGSVSPPYPVASSRAVPTTWTPWEGTFRTSAVMDNPGMYFRWFVNHTEGTNTTTRFYFTGFSVTEMVNGTEITPDSITSANIKADAITAKHTITGALIQTDILANKGIKLKNEGLEVYSPEGEKTLSITAGQGVDYIGIWGHEKAIVNEETGTLSFPVNPDTGSPYDPEQVATITSKGEISGKSLEVNDLSVAETLQFSGEPMDGHGSGNHGPTIMGRDLLGSTYTDFFNDNYGESGSAWLTPLPHGLLSNSYHNGWSGASGSSWSVEGNPGKVQVLTHVRDTVEIKNGRGYLITYTTPAFKSTDGKAGSPGAAVVKYTTGRTLGVDAGSTLHGSRYYISGSSDFDNPGRTIYAVGGQDLPVGDITLGVEVYVYDGRRIESTETADARYWSINVLDVGSAFKGNTGNVSSISKKVPAAPTSPPVFDPPPAPKPPVKKTYTKTWNASWWATYWVGNGNGINSGLKSPKAAQGRPPGVGYNQRGAIGFPNMLGASDLNGVLLGDLKKVEVYVYAAHWYSSAGGTLEIGTHGHTSKPSTMSVSLVTNRKSQSLKKPEGRWVTLPSSVHAGVLSGSVRGIQAYTTSTSLSKYGYLDGKKSKIRVTYAK